MLRLKDVHHVFVTSLAFSCHDRLLLSVSADKQCMATPVISEQRGCIYTVHTASQCETHAELGTSWIVVMLVTGLLAAIVAILAQSLGYTL